MNWNPFKKKAVPGVTAFHFEVTLNGHIGPATEEEPGTPWIKVEGFAGPVDALRNVAGHILNFKRCPPEWRKELNEGSGRLTVQFKQIRPFLETIR